jgi:CheY-like chemotaxis protein
MVVALTGWGHAQDKEEAVAAGFDAHLTKPANPAELRQLLTNRAEPSAS